MGHLFAQDNYAPAGAYLRDSFRIWADCKGVLVLSACPLTRPEDNSVPSVRLPGCYFTVSLPLPVAPV
jgi:hypothetical protein